MTDAPNPEGASTHPGAADPRTHPWGYWGADPWPAGTQSIGWFSSPLTMIDHLIASADSFEEGDALKEGRDRLMAARGVLANHSEIEPKDLRRTLEPVAVDQFVWAGTFDELRNGAGEQPEYLIESWLETDADDPGEIEARPVRDDEVEAFIEFIREFGS